VVVTSFLLFLLWLYLLIFVLLVRLFLYRVDILLEDTVVKELASNIDIETLDHLGQSEFGVGRCETDHGLECTDGDGNTDLVLVIVQRLGT